MPRRHLSLYKGAPGRSHAKRKMEKIIVHETATKKSKAKKKVGFLVEAGTWNESKFTDFLSEAGRKQRRKESRRWNEKVKSRRF